MPNSGKGSRAMSPVEFRAWRKAMGFKQKEAADVLGLKKRMIQYYEKGERDGKNVAIPKTVRLACYAVMQGVGDFNGTDATPLADGMRSPIEEDS